MTRGRRLSRLSELWGSKIRYRAGMIFEWQGRSFLIRDKTPTVVRYLGICAYCGGPLGGDISPLSEGLRTRCLCCEYLETCRRSL